MSSQIIWFNKLYILTANENDHYLMKQERNDKLSKSIYAGLLLNHSEAKVFIIFSLMCNIRKTHSKSEKKIVEMDL